MAPVFEGPDDVLVLVPAFPVKVEVEKIALVKVMRPVVAVQLE